MIPQFQPADTLKNSKEPMQKLQLESQFLILLYPVSYLLRFHISVPV